MRLPSEGPVAPENALVLLDSSPSRIDTQSQQNICTRKERNYQPCAIEQSHGMGWCTCSTIRGVGHTDGRVSTKDIELSIPLARDQMLQFILRQGGLLCRDHECTGRIRKPTRRSMKCVSIFHPFGRIRQNMKQARPIYPLWMS